MHGDHGRDRCTVRLAVSLNVPPLLLQFEPSDALSSSHVFPLNTFAQADNSEALGILSYALLFLGGSPPSRCQGWR